MRRVSLQHHPETMHTRHPSTPSSSVSRDEAPAAARATTTLDAGALAGLRELDPQGRNGLLERVVKAFQESLARLSPQLRSAMAAGDLKGVRHVAHTLKSSAASIGALRLAALCGELEAAVRGGALEGLQARVDAVSAEIENVKPALENLTAPASG
jgi:two-component system, sensor histidine kinase and response regulator